MEQCKTCWIGADLGGTNLRIGSVDEDGKVLAFEKYRTELLYEGGRPGERLAQILASFRDKYCSRMRTEGVSLGIPGTLNSTRREICQVPNICGLDDLTADFLEDALDTRVVLVRDVCTALVYDREEYKIPDCEILIGIYVGTGIGNVVFVNGKELTGKHGVAGELGHIPVIGDETPCGCGNKGCAESVAGGKYLAKLCRTTFQDTPISEIFTQKADHPLIEQFLYRLGCIIATEASIFDPDYLLLGGGVLAMKDFPMERLTGIIREHTRKPLPANGLKIIHTGDHEQKGVVGAVLYARSLADRQM